MNMSIGCSSVCEKNKDRMCGEKLKKITFKTLLINSPFDWKYLALKLMDITTEMSGKN